MSTDGQLIDVAPAPVRRPARKVRRGVHVRALVAQIEAAVIGYQRRAHSSRRVAAARAAEVALALAEIRGQRSEVSRNG